MKKAPTVTSQGRKSSKPDYINSTPSRPSRWPLMPARSIRLAKALLKGPLTREEADSIAPASNAPHYAKVLRDRLGLSLPCERVPFVTTDGIPSWHGRYHATPKDRRIIREYLQAVHGGVK